MAAGVVGGIDYNGIGLAQGPHGRPSGQGVVGSLMAILSDPNASNEAKQEALALLGSRYPAPISRSTSNTIGDDTESPEEILQALVTKLKNKLAHGGKLSAQDINDLKAAQAAVSTSTSPQFSAVNI